MPQKPLMIFEIEDQDKQVHCAKGHTTFQLILRIRLKGAMITRIARCTECGQEEAID